MNRDSSILHLPAYRAARTSVAGAAGIDPGKEQKRDALQALPGSGGVRVTLETDPGITGSGTAGFGLSSMAQIPSMSASSTKRCSATPSITDRPDSAPSGSRRWTPRSGTASRARVKTVRAEVGDRIGIMVDANQSLSTSDAVRRGRAFEEFGCVWWEEPIPADDASRDRTARARVSRSLGVARRWTGPAQRDGLPSERDLPRDGRTRAGLATSDRERARVAADRTGLFVATGERWRRARRCDYRLGEPAVAVVLARAPATACAMSPFR